MYPYHQKSPVNDGWNDVVHPPQTHFDGWPTMSFPLPPPPLKQPAQHIASVTSHAHSTQPLKRLKSIAQEPEPSKGKQLANSAKSDQSETSSHSVTSHSQHPRHEDKHISFGDMHPEASSVKGKIPIKADSQVLKVVDSKDSGQRQTASHKKYDFLFCHVYFDLTIGTDFTYFGHEIFLNNTYFWTTN
jgi:hypothetical protein